MRRSAGAGMAGSWDATSGATRDDDARSWQEGTLRVSEFERGEWANLTRGWPWPRATDILTPPVKHLFLRLAPLLALALAACSSTDTTPPGEVIPDRKAGDR